MCFVHTNNFDINAVYRFTKSEMMMHRRLPSVLSRRERRRKALSVSFTQISSESLRKFSALKVSPENLNI